MTVLSSEAPPQQPQAQRSEDNLASHIATNGDRRFAVGEFFAAGEEQPIHEEADELNAIAMVMPERPERIASGAPINTNTKHAIGIEYFL